MSGAPSQSLATPISVVSGAPPASSVASAPVRASRISRLAAAWARASFGSAGAFAMTIAGLFAQRHGNLAQFSRRSHVGPAGRGGRPPRNTFSRSMVSILSQPAQGATSDENGSFMPTIALVDDDCNILTSVSLSLEAEGYRVQTYTDGSSALEGLKANPPDLAIFDIKMPRMDGMELLRRLRQKSDLPVIFLTSKDEEIDE